VPLLGAVAAGGRGAAAEPPADGWIAPRIEEVAFASAALGRERKCVVVHPAAAAERPVLFLLHGRGRHRRSLVDLPDCRRAFLAADCWIVLPDGDDGWYIDSPVAPADRYEAALTEVIRLIGMRYPVPTDPVRRTLAGWSMGGYGAVHYAEAHPGEFGRVASLIGLLDFPRPETLPAGRNYPVPAARFGSDPAVWRRFNPLHGLAALRGKALLVVTAEDAFDRVMNEEFSAALAAAGIPHEFRRLPGGHTLAVVRAALPGLLEFAGGRAVPSTPP
jgi:enterochelin esterase-like enzyme